MSKHTCALCEPSKRIEALRLEGEAKAVMNNLWTRMEGEGLDAEIAKAKITAAMMCLKSASVAFDVIERRCRKESR